MARNPRRELPWAFQPSTDRYETARYLLMHCGGDVGKAIAAVHRASAALKKEPHRPEINDTAAVWMARAIQRDTNCSMRQAQLQAARHFTNNPADEKRMFARIKDKSATTPEPVIVTLGGITPAVGVSYDSATAFEDARREYERLRALAEKSRS